MNYPLISEYVESIKLAEDNFAELTNLRPVLGEDGTPVMSSGNFAVVFKMQDTQTGKFHAVRCFHREQAGRAESYKLIEAELNKVSSPYVVSFRYMERELFVDSKQTTETEFPVLFMDWVEGVTLDKYLCEHIADKRALDMLTYHFSQLAVWLMPQPFAHGDLKPDNILVRPDGTPVLVDYDGMFVPAMQGQKARELGSPDFRHPQRTEEDFGERMDDFSLISILLSLKLTALHPEYLAEYGASDCLLFSAKDYADIANCQLLKAVLPSADAELNRLASLFLLCHSTKNLANVSFLLLDAKKPKELILSTKVTYEDLKNAWTDEYGVKYSQDRKRLLRKHNNTNLERYVILEGIEIIGEWAFEGCSALKEVSIPNSVTDIGKAAFLRCSTLKEVCIPNSVTAIGDWAFGGCSALKEVCIPNSVIEIKGNPFAKCKCHITCHSPQYVFDNGILYTARKDKIISCVTDDEIIIIPNSVTAIGDSAFSGCSALKEVCIPNSVTDIGNLAFEGCAALKEVCIPNSVTDIGNRAFEGCSALKEVSIPNSVTDIGEWAFRGCSALKEVSIPNSVTAIEYSAFEGCSALKEVSIPNSVIEIKGNPFAKCKCHITCHSLQYVFDNGILYTARKDKIISCVTDNEIIIIPNSVTAIGNSAFSGCSALKEISIPNSVTAIGYRAFRGCSALKEVSIPNSVTAIGGWAFKGCSALKKVSISNSVTAIRIFAFWGCDALKEIAIPRHTEEKFAKLLPQYKDKLVEQ